MASFLQPREEKAVPELSRQNPSISIPFSFETICMFFIPLIAVNLKIVFSKSPNRLDSDLNRQSTIQISGLVHRGDFETVSEA
ncbi:hypothetical protein DY000_02058880 [Brassica cretica]|uniref:Uncharacterized protein n=1 Tax=Brassica cretica TaxID=69181 RepID=A0ABQ7AT10_BRACR|nr:hypothetical protein DY000_02058880 [Brassica cretica]